MKKALLINSLILTATSLLFNTVGISFRVFVSNKIGAEGMGLFQLVISIYMMAAIFVASGINIAVTRLIAEEGGRRSHSVSKALLKRAFAVSFLFSIPALLTLFLGADYIGTEWLDDKRTVLSLKILALDLPFIGISACIKGYFYAVSKVLRPAASQAFELVVQIVVTIKILDYFMAMGLEYACAAIVLGAMLSELASCSFISILYQFEIYKGDRILPKVFYQKRILNKILCISLPISVSSLLRSGLKALENIMIPMGFEKYGYSKKLSLEAYGKIQGMVMPILFFPASILIAFSTLLIPEVSEANALNHKKRVRYSVSRSLQLTFIMSILITGIFLLFSDKLGFAIYDNSEIGIMLKTLALLIPFMYIDIVVDALLKGLNQQVSALKYNMIEAVFRIVLIYYLVPKKGVMGFIFVLYTSNFLNTALSIRKLLKITKIKLKVVDWVLKPVLSIAASGFVVIFLSSKIDLGCFSAGIYLTIGILLICILYAYFLIQLGCLTKDDRKWFKSIFQYQKEVPVNSGLINKDI